MDAPPALALQWPMSPLISIVTPCLNRAGMIGQAIDSVLAQGYPRVEHIVIDGGSTDGTLDVLAGHPHLRVVSEPDGGIYDALNKGLALAGGELIGHLNSDDLYVPGAFAALAQAFRPGLDAVCGGAEIVEGDRVVRRLPNPGFGLAEALLGVPAINARFFSRPFLDRVGPYSLAFKLAADRDFLVRAALAGCRWQAVPQLVYRYRMHDGSATITADPAAARRFNLDNRALAEHWLARPEATGELARLCRRLYGASVVHLALLGLKRGDLAGAIGHLLTRDGAPSLRPLAAALWASAQHLVGGRAA